jgi:hypothetical protein
MKEKNLENLLNNISSFIKEFPPRESDQMNLERENQNVKPNRIETVDDYEKKKMLYKVLFKVMILENIELIS